MVTPADAIYVLVPTAQQPIDYLLQDDGLGAGQYIKEWNLPDPQPTPEQLAAVTEDQVTAARKSAIRTEATTAAFSSFQPADVANRTDAVITHTVLNDFREYFGAILTLIGKTPADVQAVIDQARANFVNGGGAFEQKPTPSAQIANTIMRVPESKILQIMATSIQSGYGDPIK